MADRISFKNLRVLAFRVYLEFTVQATGEYIADHADRIAG